MRVITMRELYAPGMFPEYGWSIGRFWSREFEYWAAGLGLGLRFFSFQLGTWSSVISGPIVILGRPAVIITSHATWTGNFDRIVALGHNEEGRT